MPFELTTAMLITDVENEPAVSSPTPLPAAMTARAPSARRSAPASAVAETNPSSGSWLRPSGSGMIAARGIRRGALGDRPRALDDAADPGLVQAVRARHADPVVVDDTNLELRVVLAHVLVDPVVGEPRERGVLPDVERLGRLRGRVRQRTVEEVVDLRAGGYHRPTPTFTPRNRAGAAPWPTWPVCTGSPLPQFGTPHSVHSSALQIASQLPQNWGVMPV